MWLLRPFPHIDLSCSVQNSKPTGLLHPKRILLLPNRWALLQITIVFDCDEADIAAQLNTTTNPLVKKDSLKNDTEIWKGIFGSDVSTEWVNGLLELARSVFQIERHFLGKASRIALRCPSIL